QGGPQLGHAEVNVQGTWSGSIPARLEARAILHEGCTGRALGWTMLGEVKVAGDFNFKVMIPAGGWYRLEVRAVAASGAAIAQTEVNPIGVGEVFLISGQSYAAGANDELQRVEDPLERSVLLDYQAKSWRTAHDPFPHVDNGGTIWPAFANAIQPILRVPVGLVNVAVDSFPPMVAWGRPLPPFCRGWQSRWEIPFCAVAAGRKRRDREYCNSHVC
ncbi:MAG: hypothetical protein EBS30_11115, partial [Planctomycetes bacterium]|nr:hypothetical protein [Planctomycetota bacterium]